jgi:hypothetical protein
VSMNVNALINIFVIPLLQIYTWINLLWYDSWMISIWMPFLFTYTWLLPPENITKITLDNWLLLLENQLLLEVFNLFLFFFSFFRFFITQFYVVKIFLFSCGIFFLSKIFKNISKKIKKTKIKKIYFIS